MTCDNCQQKIDYCFYINNEHWLKAVGKKEGHVCAHCILQKLGGLDWYIVWNEPQQKSFENGGQVVISCSNCASFEEGDSTETLTAKAIGQGWRVSIIDDRLMLCPECAWVNGGAA